MADTRVNINDNVNIDALIWFDYDNTVCTTGTITINGFAAVHQGSGVYRITKTSASVTSVTYNTVACSAESTYGITTVDQNSQSSTVIWDRIYDVGAFSSTDTRIDVGSSATITVTLHYDYDETDVTDGTVTINSISATHLGSGQWRIQPTQASVTSVTYDTVVCSGNTYGITSMSISSNVIQIWDRFEFVSVATDDTRINIGANFELRYQIRYDFDDVTFDNTKGSITGFTWDVTNSWWDKTVTGSSSVTSTNYDENYVSITDSTYGLTTKQDVAGADIITDRLQVRRLYRGRYKSKYQ